MYPSKLDRCIYITSLLHTDEKMHNNYLFKKQKKKQKILYHLNSSGTWNIVHTVLLFMYLRSKKKQQQQQVR